MAGGQGEAVRARRQEGQGESHSERQRMNQAAVFRGETCKDMGRDRVCAVFFNALAYNKQPSL